MRFPMFCVKIGGKEKFNSVIFSACKLLNLKNGIMHHIEKYTNIKEKTYNSLFNFISRRNAYYPFYNKYLSVVTILHKCMFFVCWQFGISQHKIFN